MGVPVRIGNYVLGDVLGEGGTATVHAALRVGDGGFRRVVAVKRLRQPFASDPEVKAMLLDEARLAGRLAHRNVVSTHDVFAGNGELLVAMDFVHGLSLFAIERQLAPAGIPPRIAVAITCDVLAGLHAAHELTTPSGALLDIVHRDVSPANVLVGVDGEAKVIDFGIAKAVGRLQSTRTGVLKGKLAYMAPELFDGACDRRADVYAAALCLWQMIAGELPFSTNDDGALMEQIMTRPVPRLGRSIAGIPNALDAVVLRGMERDPALRFASAQAMSEALRAATAPASPPEVAAWLAALGHDALAECERHRRDLERDARWDGQAASLVSVPLVPAPHASSAREVTARDATVRSRASSGSTRAALVLGAILALAASIASTAALLARGTRTSSIVDAPMAVPPSAPDSTSSSAVNEHPPPAVSLVEQTPPPASTMPSNAPFTPARAAPPRSRRHDCETPTWLDSTGRKHYKTECNR